MFQIASLGILVVAGSMALGVAHAGSPDVIYYVDAAAVPGGDGLSWSAPFRYLQDALDAADREPPDASAEIRVAQGVYRPDLDDSGMREPGDREARFTLQRNRTLLGGFRGPFTSGHPDERIPELFVTRLSGDLLGDDKPGFANREDNSRRVVHVRFGPVLIDGLVIEGGKETDGTGLGSGLFVAGDLQLSRCIVRANEALLGGGLAVTGTVLVDRCTFTDNRAAVGAALFGLSADGIEVADTLFDGNDVSNVAANAATVFTQGSPVTLERCVFQDTDFITACQLRGSWFTPDALRITVRDCTFERAAERALAIEDYAQIAVERCRFLDNNTYSIGTTYGAGLLIGRGSTQFGPSGTIRDCRFERNVAGFGAGLFIDATFDLSVLACDFIDNRAFVEGGAVAVANLSAHRFERCSFIRNRSDISGGAFYRGVTSGVPKQPSFPIVDSTFLDNDAPFGGAVASVSDQNVFINCYFGGNVADEGGAIHLMDPQAENLILGCAFTGNSATQSAGGAVAIVGTGSVAATNCTLVDNTAATIGGGCYSEAATLAVANAIHRFNSPDQLAAVGGLLTVEYANIEGGFVGTQVIDSDPRFVDRLGPDGIAGTGDENLRLTAGSPSVDAGNNERLPQGIFERDLNGDYRRLDDPTVADTGAGAAPIVDHGAFERRAFAFGDLNCDGLVSVGDVNPFILALTDPAGYAAAFPNCEITGADCNNDQQITVSDINCFVGLLLGT